MNFLNSVETFLQVVELGNFTKTAQARNVTPGMISTQISDLEREFGVRLLHRTTRKIVVTEEGSLLYQRLKRIVQDIDETKSAFLTPSMLTGKVRVVAGGLMTRILMLPIVVEFGARYPGITLEFILRNMLRGTKGDDGDLTIRYGPFGDSSLVVKPLGITHVIVAGSPDYLARHGTPREPRDLLNHRCCGFIDSGTGQLTEWTLHDGKGEQYQFFPRHTLMFNDTVSLLDAAIRGLGLVWMSEAFLQETFDQGLLVPVLPEYKYRLEGPCVLYHRDKMMSARVRAFLDFLIEKFPSDALLLDTCRKLRTSNQG